MTDRKISYNEAILEAIREEMRRDPRTFVMGEDLWSGLFGDLGLDEFGPARVRNTPISEAGFLGAAVGAALTGLRPIVCMGNSCFMYAAMDQVISQLAKNRYMFGGQRNVPLVVRSRLSYGISIAAHHSDRPYPMFMNIPGLKIVMPGGPLDAKGLLKQAVREDDPVLIFEDETIGSMKSEDVPEAMDPIPFGVANIRRAGSDVTIVALGGCVRSALSAADALSEESGIEAEVIDPRTLVPLDSERILESVRKTGHLVVTEPAVRTCGAAAEIAAIVAEGAFAHLRGPIVRVTAPDVPVPFSPALEKILFPNADRIAAAVMAVLGEIPAVEGGALK